MFEDTERNGYATYDIQSVCQIDIPVGELPACTGQKLETGPECQEDYHEDDIGPDAADEVHVTKDTPEEVVERCEGEMNCQSSSVDNFCTC